MKYWSYILLGCSLIVIVILLFFGLPHTYKKVPIDKSKHVYNTIISKESTKSIQATSTKISDETTDVIVKNENDNEIVVTDQQVCNVCGPLATDVVYIATKNGEIVSNNANNQTDSTDHNLFTSGNLFGNDSYILYGINTSRHPERIHPVIGASNPCGYEILVEFLDGNQSVISTFNLQLNGFKEIHDLFVPPTARFIKVNGSNQTDVYIWEMDVKQ